MDVYEAEEISHKGATGESLRPPLVPSEKNIAVINRKPKTRDVPSRYKAAVSSPSSLSTPAVARRYPSPNVSRTVPSSSPCCPKRPHSAERRRPSTPPSPPRPSTPVQDASLEMQGPSRRLVGGRTSEGLWPSTMRSLCVSFQSDTFSLPVSKKEKPVTHSPSDHTLKSSANVANGHAETPGVQRKATPERKKTPLRGRNTSDQSENSKPMDNSHAHNHCLPGRKGGKVSSSALTKSIDLTDKVSKTSSLSFSGRGISPLRRTPVFDGMARSIKKSETGASNQVNSYEVGRRDYDMYAVGPDKYVSSSVGVPTNSSGKASPAFRASRSQSLPTPGLSRPPSPSKVPFLSSTPSRGTLSPSWTRPSSPFPSASSATSRSSSSSSVLSFIADVRKGKKGANHIEDAHQVRLFYNRYMQWRYVNARANAALFVQKITAEKALCNVWNTTSKLQDSVTMRSIELWQLKQELKLNSVLNGQMDYLDDWALIEREHFISVSGAIEALEACTLRLPVTAGARADIHTLKSAICSAVDMMQAIASVMHSLLPRVEGMNCLVSELANVKAHERAMLDECGDLLASTAAMQVEENSLRTHLIQLKKALPMEISQSKLLKYPHDPPDAR